MDFKKSKVFFVKLMVAYWVFALVIYAVSFPQFKYTDVTGEAPAAATIIGEFTDGHEIRQSLIAPVGTLRGVSLMIATYGWKSEGELIVTLEDADHRSLTEFSVPLSDVNDNDYQYNRTDIRPAPACLPIHGHSRDQCRQLKIVSHTSPSPRR